MALTADQVREQRIKEAREYYLSDEGFLDYVRDCGAAPDAEWEPHGRGAQFILDWKSYHDPESGQELFKKKMVLWPRGSFKSQVFTVGMISWLVARDPNIRWFIGSETGRQARLFLRNIMEIIESPWYEEHFGIHKDPKRWSYNNGFVSAQRTILKKESTVAAFGAGEVQTGAHWDGGNLDDPVSQKNTQTPDAIRKVNTWIGELLAQLDPGSKLLYIGTIHHHADYSAMKIKKEDAHKDWEISRHEWINPDGSLFFPARLTHAYVESQKREMPTRQFYAYYHNKPQSDEEQIFLPEYFRVIPDQDIPTAVWSYILTDFAIVADEKNDRTVFWLVSLDQNRYAYVRDIYIKRAKPSDSVDWCCRMWNDNLHLNMKAITVERSTHEEFISGYFEEIRRKTMTRPVIKKIEGRSEEVKKNRIAGSEPRWRDARIYFAQSLRDQWNKWKPMFEEMTEWPFSGHDDIPDAISDLDKRDARGRWYCPGPPAGWHAHMRQTRPPSTVSGNWNPDYGYDARQMLSRMHKGDAPKEDIWHSKTNDLFRQVRPRRTQ